MVDWRSSRGSDADRAHFFIAVPRIKISLSREALGFMLLVRRSDQQHRFVSFEWAAPDATASRPAPSRKAHNASTRLLCLPLSGVRLCPKGSSVPRQP